MNEYNLKYNMNTYIFSSAKKKKFISSLFNQTNFSNNVGFDKHSKVSFDPKNINKIFFNSKKNKLDRNELHCALIVLEKTQRPYCHKLDLQMSIKNPLKRLSLSHVKIQITYMDARLFAATSDQISHL